MRTMAFATLLALPQIAPLVGQTSDSSRFEVVSVRANNSVERGGGISALTGSQFTARNVPLRMILLYAYELRDVQLVGAPEWTESANFDIAAKFPEGEHPVTARRHMLQTMLADRFQLVVHRETSELPIYKLVMARADRRPGPNLIRSEVDCVQWLADKRSQIISGEPHCRPRYTAHQARRSRNSVCRSRAAHSR